MIIMDLKIDNLYAFKDFHINFSYPKKIVDSYLENEHLTGFPNFRYKKINILMGANASGKTTLGLAIMSIFNFINHENRRILSKVDDTSKNASFSIDFITNKPQLNRVTAHILTTASDQSDNELTDKKILVSLKHAKINLRDRYESCAKKLDNIKDQFQENYSETLSQLSDFGWHFTYPKDLLNSKKSLPKGDKNFSKILKKVFMCFDTGIVDVKPSSEVEDAYIITMENSTLVMQDGEFVKDENILSSGTKSSIDIAVMINAMLFHKNGFYYCDEKFSYVHSDLEKSFLILMVSLLGENEQLFFTTHNADVLDIPLPKHSFTFLKKVNEYEEKKIIAADASSYLKKNTDSLRNAVDNDLFGIAPSINLIYEIEDMKQEETDG